MNNVVSLIGTVEKKPIFSHEAYGERFYKMIFAISRTSGTKDYIPVIFSENLLKVSSVEIGKKLMIYGEYRSYNKQSDNKIRLVLDVFAIDIWDVTGMDEDSNAIELNGYICKTPVYRMTPLGREITNLILAVNRVNGRADYIPLICWGRLALYSKKLSVGDSIKISGRIQSRNYVKDSKMHTAYEVSVCKLTKEDRMETNDKEVDYESHCEYCKYATLEDFEEPCNECMETFFRNGTSVPLNYEEA